MTDINELNHRDCERIPSDCVNAYLDLSLNPENPSELILDHSWGTEKVDLEPAVKDAETMTYMDLYPEDNPTFLRYRGEDGLDQCIDGEDLARIIPMVKLKDVDQVTAPVNGDVYMYNGNDSTWYTFNLQDFVDETNNNITSLQNRVTALEGQVATINQQIANILNVIAKPGGIPDDARIVWGNRNIYGDITNTNQRGHGVFTHATNTDLTDDLYFS